jgi:hypothetical protein
MEVHHGLSRTGHSQCLLTCDFDLGGGVSKKKNINIGSTSGGCEFHASAPNLQNSEISTADAIEAAS